ncbi:MAG: hypothetical protein ACI9UK_002564 [Candidatus Krumholzibacteriia bacterium]|jgi:uncharacterized protein (TIGR01244 family)
MKHLVSFTTLCALAIVSLIACSSPQSSSNSESSSNKESPSNKDTDVSTVELAAVSLGTIRNVHQLGDVWFGGQPSESDFGLIKDAGIKTVINLRHDAENEGMDEAAVVAAAEMGYAHIPFSNPGQLTDEVFDAVRHELKTAPRPLLIHCASANRVGATWLSYRVLDEGVPYDDALLEAKEIGLRSSSLEELARQYITAHQGD